MWGEWLLYWKVKHYTPLYSKVLVPRPAALASGSLLEMWNLRTHSRYAESEPVIMRPQAPSVHTKVQHRPVSRRIQVKKLLLFSSEVRHETGGCGDKAVGRGV